MVIILEIKITSLEEMEIQGIKKIVEITPKKACLELDNTPLEILGEGLELIQINNENNKIKIKGKIHSVQLSKTSAKNDSFFKKLFS